MNKDILVVGESLGKFLSSYDNTNVFVFSGKTMKGFTKNKSPIYKKVLSNINKYNKKYNYVIFNFGSVDNFFSFYYDSFVKVNKEYKNPTEVYNNWKINIEPIIVNYVNKISKIRTRLKKIIFPVWYSILEEENIPFSLQKYLGLDIYNSLSDNNKEIFRKLITFRERRKRTNFMNKILERECKKHKIIFNNFLTNLLDKNKRVKNKYKDVSILNVHYLYEPMIMDLSKLKFFKYLGLHMTDKLEKKLKKEMKEYLDFKKKKLKNIEETSEEYIKYLENYRKEQNENMKLGKKLIIKSYKELDKFRKSKKKK